MPQSDLEKKENIGFLNKINKPYYKKQIKYGNHIDKLKEFLGF